MSIKYEVTANPVQAHSYYPRVVHSERISLDRIIANIVAETCLSETDTRAVINALKHQVVACLLDGKSADLEGLVCFYSSLHESLPTASANVSSAVTVRVRARPATALQKLVRTQAHLERVYSRQRMPQPITLFDVQSQRHDVYTPGNIARLCGDDLTFDPTAADEGIFFCSVDTDQAMRVASYAFIGTREVIFLVPADLGGCQSIELRTRFGTEIFRVGRMPTSVTSAM